MLLKEDEEAKNRADDWLTSTVQALKKASPMSLKISLRSVCLLQALKLQLVNSSISKLYIEFVYESGMILDCFFLLISGKKSVACYAQDRWDRVP